jgi:hypothetical protein
VIARPSTRLNSAKMKSKPDTGPSAAKGYVSA